VWSVNAVASAIAIAIAIAIVIAIVIDTIHSCLSILPRSNDDIHAY
jgi:hypothetical protein